MSVCWYVHHGGCRKIGCGYWHPKFAVCTHWQQGTCKYGASCRLLHQTASAAEIEYDAARAATEEEEAEVAKLMKNLNKALAAKAKVQRSACMVAAATIVLLTAHPQGLNEKGNKGKGKEKGKGRPVGRLLVPPDECGGIPAEEGYQRNNFTMFEMDQRELIVRLLHDEGNMLRGFAAIERALRVEIGTERQQRESLRDELCTERQQRQEQFNAIMHDVEALRAALTQSAGGSNMNAAAAHQPHGTAAVDTLAQQGRGGAVAGPGFSGGKGAGDAGFKGGGNGRGRAGRGVQMFLRSGGFAS
eukprot:TRINITY_DN2623_c0_g3_i1.p2 TRINITY_DN2623_c0_g3~~TRINITY_DN2623_c0_g3_i1.p2  ORF type:complete len:331 (+),score=112.84 TRINITY_DN2623_c0_g3_i1:89-994(+)